MTRIRLCALCGIAAGAVLVSCSSMREAGTAGGKVTKASAELSPTQGNNARGTVTFTQQSDGIRVVAHLTGLPAGTHGFHIHEKGDCSAPDGSSAGGHFNPMSMPHGGPEAAQHHEGDLGNIVADSTGTATYDRVLAFLGLNGPTSIVGRSVVVHLDADDLTSQPAGNSGPRIACGVIK